MPIPEERWEALKGGGPGEVFTLIDPDHPLRLYIGLGSRGEPLLLLVTPEAVPAGRELNGIRLITSRRQDGQYSLTLECTDPALIPVFMSLCDDLYDRLRRVADSAHPVSPLMQRLEQWVRMLSRARNGLLDDSEVRGLAAELLFMRDVLAPMHGLKLAVDGWGGPYGAEQDFRIGPYAWEVKSLRPGGPNVQISSERQLCTDGELELAVVVLEEPAPSGEEAVSVNMLVRELLELAAPAACAEKLEDGLMRAGYTPRVEYDGTLMRLQRIDRYRVEGAFPRLCKESIPDGVSRVTYYLALDKCAAYRADGEELTGS